MALNKFDYLRYLWEVYGLNRGTICKSWRGPARVDLSDFSSEVGSGAYPIDFSLDDGTGVLTDSGGIPMIDYATIGRHYNPWFIGHIALGRFTRWRKSSDDRFLRGFRKLADWMAENAVSSKIGVRWLYDFDWFGDRVVPWQSGLSQAHGISTLLRAAKVFKDRRYENLARQATAHMLAPIVDGGTLHEWPDGTVSIEEQVSLPPIAILNGHLFAVIAAWEAGRFFENESYLETADLGWKFVQERMPLYDLGYWSSYSLKVIAKGIPDIASYHYHDVHVALLRVSAAITRNAFFSETADRFESYQKNPGFRRKAIWMKRLAKLLR